ncbi:SDR family oxidoreductase [Streptomyces sp. NPDC006643]|uniref:SDR family oxidoreductase n=1 Tax=Streptomyces sp. NPDC006643 TaxID=3364756 RepID=UPI003688BAA3
MRSFAGAARERHGRNAGVMPLSTLDALRVEEWNRMIDVNIRGVPHGIAAVPPVMREQGAGHIVNVASISGLRVDPAAAIGEAIDTAPGGNLGAADMGARPRVTSTANKAPPGPT